MKLINIGFGNVVSAQKLVAIVSPESAPIKRIVQDARDRGTLIDATYGRRTRAVMREAGVIVPPIRQALARHRALRAAKRASRRAAPPRKAGRIASGP